MSRLRRFPYALAAALAILAPSCARTGSAAPLPPPPTVLRISMQEYSFNYAGGEPEILQEGRAAFHVRNDGRLAHDVALIGVPEDLTGSIKDHIESEKKAAFFVFVHLPPVAPALRGVFAFDLTPGRYGLVCLLEDPDGQVHAEKGMNSEFRVA